MDKTKQMLWSGAIRQILAENRNKVLFGLAVVTPVTLYGLYFFKRPKNMPPGPLGYPYIGSMLELSTDVPGDFKRLGKKYGEIFSLWTGGNKYIVVLNSYNVIKEAYMAKGAQFCDRIPNEFFAGYDIPDNLFNSDYDADYKSTRKVVTQGIRKFISSKLDTVVHLEFQKLEEYIVERNGAAVKICEPIQHMITNVVSSMLFNKSHPFNHEELQIVMNQSIKNFEIGISYLFTSLLNESIFTAKYEVSMLAELKPLRSYILSEIEGHLSTFEENNPRDMLDLYLKAGFHNTVGKEMVCNNTLMLMPDAINSGSVAMEWLTLHLLKYPQYKTIIKEEVDSIVVSAENNVIQTEHRSQMPLTESFIMEVLRIRSPQVIGFLNKPERGAKLCGYDIPQEAWVVANYMSVHFDENIYPDPYNFKPERFLQNDGSLIVDDKLVPFGMGRRKCIGEQLIRNMLFLFVTKLVQNYDITTTEDIDLSASLETGSNRPQDIKVSLTLR